MKKLLSFWSAILLCCFLSGACAPGLQGSKEGYSQSADPEKSGHQEETAARPSQPAPFVPPPGNSQVHVKILAFNDFHGHLSKDGLLNKGSAPVLAAYLQTAAQGWEGRTFLVHAGDQVGASPAASALLQEEPSIRFLNLLADRPGWSIIGTLGNHEFDNGKEKLLRLTRRTCKGGPFLDSPFLGARFPYICANVICEDTGRPLLLPFVIREVKGVPIAFIGAVTIETRHKVTESKVLGLRFKDEAEAINYQVNLLKRWGIRTFVVLLHEGGKQTPYYKEPTKTRDVKVEGRIVDIVARLDDEVDVVISGHSHEFTNALIETNNYLKNKNHKAILVTQAYWHGEAFAEIELKIDRVTKDVVEKWAQIKPTCMNEGPGLHPDPLVSDLVKQAEDKAKDMAKQIIKREIKDPIGIAQKEILKKPNESGESALGNLVADAHRDAGHTQFAFAHLRGMRAERIGKGNGDVSWRDLFCVQPFRSNLVIMILTGQEIYDLLKQQWAEAKSSGFLQVSGLKYTYTNHPPHIIDLREDSGKVINKNAYYTVTINSYLAGGGDYFTEFKDKSAIELNELDFTALINYVKKLPRPFISKIDNRIIKLD